LINNAYGLQCSYICKLINRACTVGRVDAIVCSTDKNFMVPVGKKKERDFFFLLQDKEYTAFYLSNPIPHFCFFLVRCKN